VKENLDEKTIVLSDKAKKGLRRIYDYHKTSSGSGESLNTGNDIWRLVYYEMGGEVWDYPNYGFHHECIDQFLPLMVGVENIENIENVKPTVFPDPSTGLVNVRQGSLASIRIVDMNGRVVFNGIPSNGKLNLSLNPGIYSIVGEDINERLVITN
jgi:hypothetical protein